MFHKEMRPAARLRRRHRDGFAATDYRRIIDGAACRRREREIVRCEATVVGGNEVFDRELGIRQIHRRNLAHAADLEFDDCGFSATIRTSSVMTRA